MAARKNTLPKVEENISPYGLAKWIEANLDISFAPQRAYAYARSGRLETEVSDLGHKLVTPEKANEFIAWFMDPERTKKKETAEEVEETS